MDYDDKQDMTMDFSIHDHESERTTAVLTQLTELVNLISNHLGSIIDHKSKVIKPAKKTAKKVDVVRQAAKPMQGRVIKSNSRMPSRDFTGSSISKEEEEDDEEKLLPQLAAVGIGALANTDNEKKSVANPMSTSEGKALLTSLQDSANKLRSYLTTTRVPATSVLQPQDVRNDNPARPNL